MAKTKPPLSEEKARMRDLVKPHIDAFDFMVQTGLELAVSEMEPQEVMIDGHKIMIFVDSVTMESPLKKDDSLNPRVFPRDCRENGTTYASDMAVVVEIRIDDETQFRFERNFKVPIMVNSCLCNLRDLGPQDLLKCGEDENELGGYFIVSGNEKAIRLLTVPRRNFVHAICRPSFAKRGADTPYATVIRCVGPDQHGKTVSLHYQQDGGTVMRFFIRRQEFFVPSVVFLRCFCDTVSDREIFLRLVSGFLAQRLLTISCFSRKPIKIKSNTYHQSGDPIGNGFEADRAEILLQQSQLLGLFSKEKNLAYLGKLFRVAMQVPDHFSDVQVGLHLIRNHIFVHLKNDRDKFELLVFMMLKLFAFVKGDAVAENDDSPQNHELLVGGHLYLMLLREKLDDWIRNYSILIQRELDEGGKKKGEPKPKTGQANAKRAVPDTLKSWWISPDRALFRKIMDRSTIDVGRRLEQFLATGNITSSTGLDLMQATGFVIVAERLNYLRFLAHFRSVHRGAFFTTMKSTEVRKLLPEAWGFLCPVHTPDGPPCGLLNHITADAIVTNASNSEIVNDAHALTSLLVSLGMQPLAYASSLVSADQSNQSGSYLFVMADGRVIGCIHSSFADSLASQLRLMKVLGKSGIPATLEIAYVPLSGRINKPDSIQRGSQFPGVFLFTSPARIMRPVWHAATKCVEYVGSFEQVYLNVAPDLDNALANNVTHAELKRISILSVVAGLTPFSDFNQSPRNMYQCQMAKQTMGTPAHSIVNRTDNKLYVLNTPQRPMVVTEVHERYNFDDYPQGINAIVAVAAYTGYDMEDALILNKKSVERGFGYGTVFKSVWVDINDFRGDSDNRITARFGNPENEQGELFCTALDSDGLPEPGTVLTQHDPLYCIVNETSGKPKIYEHKDTESAVVDTVRIISLLTDTTGSRHTTLGGGPSKICIKLRYIRNPTVGDKFSSRHGQKGVTSRLYPSEDMPFTESGLVPDVIINPHAFPSRMTIGMLLESVAAKSGAIHGISKRNSDILDATAFRFNDEERTDKKGNEEMEEEPRPSHVRAVDYFGEQLRSSGLNYYGTEPMYSGITGEVFEADIFIGIVYYQRLRHMVSDKFQVRSVGPVHNLTHQPIKGRKMGGGIRFGEMERDSLLSHGASFLLKDRLLNSSDAHMTHVCRLCGSMLAITTELRPAVVSGAGDGVVCGQCKTGRGIERVEMPFVLSFLANELAAMNINLSLDLDRV